MKKIVRAVFTAALLTALLVPGVKAQCPEGDLSGNCRVDLEDLGVLSEYWLGSDPAGEVDAVVYDAPVLQHYALKKGKGKVMVVGLIFQEQSYGIALQFKSPYREEINIALLRLIEKGIYKEIHDKWFGS